MKHWSEVDGPQRHDDWIDRTWGVVRWPVYVVLRCRRVVDGDVLLPPGAVRRWRLESVEPAGQDVTQCVLYAVSGKARG